MTTKSATDVMQEAIAAAVLDGLAALKAASGGLPNNLLREISAVHANTTFPDLPKELQASIVASVRTTFARLLKEGYSVAPGQPGKPPHSATPYRRDGDNRGPRREGGGPRREGPPGQRREGAGPGGRRDRPGGRGPGAPRPGGGDRPGGDRPGGGKGAPRGGRPNRGPKPGGGKSG